MNSIIEIITSYNVKLIFFYIFEIKKVLFFLYGSITNFTTNFHYLTNFIIQVLF